MTFVGRWRLVQIQNSSTCHHVAVAEVKNDEESTFIRAKKNDIICVPSPIVEGANPIRKKFVFIFCLKILS